MGRVSSNQHELCHTVTLVNLDFFRREILKEYLHLTFVIQVQNFGDDLYVPLQGQISPGQNETACVGDSVIRRSVETKALPRAGSTKSAALKRSSEVLD